jgi:rod shape determining protein RodA
MFEFLREYFDYKTLLVTAALVIIGLVSVYSATYDARVPEIFYRQMLYAGAGLVALLILAFLPFRLLQFVSYPSYFLSILLLISVLIIGRTVSGSTSWFNFGAFRLQPSELTKITTALALATYLSRTDVSLKNFRNLLLASGIVLLPVVLIMLQPDMGTAVVYLGMFFPVLYWGGASRITIVALTAPALVAVASLFGTTPFFLAVILVAIVLYFMRGNRILTVLIFSGSVLIGISVQAIYGGLKPYQQKRIATFINPGADPLGAGYNSLQSKVAIGSGGLAGKGFLQGTQTQLNFIPEQWTDFIFCVPGEEFGFLGSAAVLLLFAVLLFRGVMLASTVKNPYGSFVAIAITATLGIHVVMNVGMALGLLPVIGVPLPFLSYGGSALLAAMAMIGILMNIYTHRKEY